MSIDVPTLGAANHQASLLDARAAQRLVKTIPITLVSDTGVMVLYATDGDSPSINANTYMLRATERHRRLLIIENTLAVPIKVAPGTADDITAHPLTGYTAVNPGQEYATIDYRPVWCYAPVTGGASAGDVAGYVRVYTEISA